MRWSLRHGWINIVLFSGDGDFARPLVEKPANDKAVAGICGSTIRSPATG